MKKRIKINVDTGTIVAFLHPIALIKNSLPIAKGKYKISLKIADCWHGKTSVIGYLDSKKDQFVIIGDSGEQYDVNQKVGVHNIHGKGIFLGTGGDGEFSATIEITKIKTIPINPYPQLLKEAKQFYKDHEYNDQNQEIFRKKFLSGAYDKKINEIAQKEYLKELNKMTDDARKVLDYLTTKKAE